jgi:hypothetical protein
MNEQTADPSIVLLLGAGASKPYGFPTGAELWNRIVEMQSHRDGAGTTLISMIG